MRQAISARRRLAVALYYLSSTAEYRTIANLFGRFATLLQIFLENRKGYHSIIMQAVVDRKYLFRDVVVGWPDSVHDARIFSSSGLYKMRNEDTLFLSSEVSETIQGCDIQPLLLGDPAYPLLPWLVKSYPENSNTPDV